MRRYFLLPYKGIGNEHMKKLLFIIIAGTAFSCAAFAQTQRQISNILREQQQWKNRQLPTNSVQRNFGGTNYAAAAWMESNKINKRNMQAIQLPKPGNAKTTNWFGGSELQSLSYASVRMQTSFMQWLSSYLPAKCIQ
jgi:hypothetical protein